MARWMADFEVEGHVSIRENEARLVYGNNDPPHEIHIRNLKTDPGTDPPLLSVQVILDSNTASEAAETSRTLLRLFLYTLAFVTNAKYSIHNLIRVVDWSPGLTDRECIQYQTFPGHDLPIPGLEQSMIDTVAAIHAAPLEPRLRRALKWFANGVSDVYLDDQFQYFWFVLETVAEVTKEPERVPDKCQRCKTPLFCPTCNETPTHRPFPKQAIQQLIAKTVNQDAEETFDIFVKVRNALLHGEEPTEIEATVGHPMAKLVNNAAKVAWAALLHALSPVIAGKKLDFMQTNTYTHDTVDIGAVMKLGALGDPNNPQIDQLQNVEITMLYEEDDSNEQQSSES